MGLTYVKAIVEAHGGSIHVSDAKVKGSNFVINLPILKYEKEVIDS